MTQDPFDFASWKTARILMFCGFFPCGVNSCANSAITVAVLPSGATLTFSDCTCILMEDALSNEVLSPVYRFPIFGQIWRKPSAFRCSYACE